MTKRKNPLVEIRRENGRRAIDKHGGVAKIARLMGHSSPSTLSQVFGPNPSRAPTENLARKLEKALDMPMLSLDQHSGQSAASSTTEVVAGVIRLVGEIMASESVNLPVQRFSDVVALAIADTMEHEGVPRESHIRQVVRLFKN